MKQYPVALKHRKPHNLVSLTRVLSMFYTAATLFAFGLPNTAWSVASKTPPPGFESAKQRLCKEILTEKDILTKHIEDSVNNVQRLFEHQEYQSRNWNDFVNGELKGQNVHMLQQAKIKELNESIWNISGTEEYLETLHDTVHQYLRKHPTLGKVLLNNHKNHFIASKLSAKEFEEKVLVPVTEILAGHMEQIFFRDNWDWHSWITQNLYLGSGKTLTEASFQVGLRRSKYTVPTESITIDKWQSAAIRQRESLVNLAHKHSLEWEQVLQLIHTHLGKTATDELVLREKLEKLNALEMLDEMKLYYDALQIADFYPLPNTTPEVERLERQLEERQNNPLSGSRMSWAVEQKMFFITAKEPKYVVVTDVEKFGAIARRYQDQWIAAGAILDELPMVYSQSTSAIEMAVHNNYSRLKQIAGAKTELRVYRSGDDVIWLFGELAPEAKIKIQAQFDEVRRSGSNDILNLKFHHSDLIDIDGALPHAEGMAKGLAEARESLMMNKVLSRKASSK